MRLIIIVLSAFLMCQLVPADVIISEFMASNSATVRDQDNDYSDWIELFNAGEEAVDLSGWYLTDNDEWLTKWQFPQGVTLAAGDFLVVFASYKDLTQVGSELHTNFKLESDGEFLALVEPDGATVAHAFSPRYPRQRVDVSYGVSAETVTLVGPEQTGQFLVPENGGLGLSWTEPDFSVTADWDDSIELGIGFQSGEGPAPVLGNVGHWRFDGNLQDENDAFHGVFAGGSPMYVTGVDGTSDGAVDFDGINDYVSIPEGNGFPVYNKSAYTIAMWVKGLPQPDYRVYSEGSTENTRPLFNIGTEVRGEHGTVDLFIRNASGSTILSHKNSTRTAFDGTWHHIAWVDEDGDARLYIDGVLDETNFSYSKQALDLNLTSIACVLRASPSHFFKGAIDDVGVWDRALSGAEVAGLAEQGIQYAGFIGTDVGEAMTGVNASAYLRIPFTMDEATSFESMQLSMKYDDGFVAYLNGVAVARRNAPETVTWQSAATVEREPGDAVRTETINLTAFTHLLQAGDNVLAVNVLNARADDDDLLLEARLRATTSKEALYYFLDPTFGEPNNIGVPGAVKDTMFSVDRGFFKAPFDVAITTETPGAEIRYTTDGSEPTQARGTLYTGPITITGTTMLRAAAFLDGLLPTNVDTHSYIFLDEVIHQTGAGYPTNWGDHPIVYKMDPNVVDAPAYRDTIVEDLKSIPTLSVVLSIDDAFNGSGGIYPNARSRIEKRASAELIYPSGASGFQVNCGVQMHGGSSRNWTSTPKHSFRLEFKGIYGPGKLRYPLYLEEGAAREFNALVLRACYTDSFTCRYSLPRYHPNDSQFTRDQWMRDMQLAMGHVSCHGMYVHLYVSGLYWGLYNVAERPDDDFAAAYYGGEASEYDVVKDSGSFRGSKARWNQMISYAKEGLATEGDYQRIQEYADIDNLMDYMILHLYGGAEDWAHHNWSAASHNPSAMPYHFYVWDQEIVMDEEYGLSRDYSDKQDDDSPAIVHYQLRANPEYRLRFADRLHKHFFNGGLLTAEPASRIMARRADEIDRAVVGESARWGDYRREPPLTRDGDWEPSRDWLYDVYFPQRPPIVMAQFRNDDLYPSVAAPSFNQHGGLVEDGFELTMTHENGTGMLYYSLDGSDPRVYGTGAVSASAQIFEGPIAIIGTKHVKARVRDGTTWSALNEAVFRVRRPIDGLRFTEIMYNPAPEVLPEGSIDGEFYEFIEFKNVGNQVIDLTDVRIEGGVLFTFPQGASVRPGRFIVLVSNATAFSERYPGVTESGIYLNRLSDGGEYLYLVDKDGTEIASAAFYDKPPWPFQADGDGFSLVASQPLPSGDAMQLDYWRLSTFNGGSPGRDDPDGSTTGWQVPGDLNQDTGLDLSDAVSLLMLLFGDDQVPLPCDGDVDSAGNLALLDGNGDGRIDLADAIALLSYLFDHGDPPALGIQCRPVEGCPSRCFNL